MKVEIMKLQNEFQIHQLVASNISTKAKDSSGIAPNVLSFGMLEHQGLHEIDFGSKLEVKTRWLFPLASPHVYVLSSGDDDGGNPPHAASISMFLAKITDASI